MLVLFTDENVSIYHEYAKYMLLIILITYTLISRSNTLATIVIYKISTF